GEARLGGIQVVREPPSYSWKTFWNAKLQGSIGDHFDSSFAGRELLIRLTNEAYFRAFRVSPMRSASIVIGKDQSLYEAQYLEEYTHERPDKAAIEEWVDQLMQFRDLCAQRGIAFVLVITPSKAAIMPEWMPEKWRR